MIKLAKLNEKHLTELTQVLYCGDLENSDDWKLLELNGPIQAAIEEGQVLCFKGIASLFKTRIFHINLPQLINHPLNHCSGGLNEKVVLCTKDRTYDVKEAGISNSLLLLPDLKMAQSTSKSPLKSPSNRANSSTERANPNNDSTGSIDDDDSYDPAAERQQERRIVKKVFHDYLECREVKPKFRKLGELLQLTRYSGPENEHYVDRSVLFTFNQLLNTTQCSKREFENGLKKFRAFELGGRMRIFDIEYEYRLVSLLLGVLTENSWPIDAIDRTETLKSISETIAPAAIVQIVFDLYTFPSPQSTSSSTLYTYDEELVCRTIAQNVLQQGSKFHYVDFMDTWQNALPEGFRVQVRKNNIFGILALICVWFWVMQYFLLGSFRRAFYVESVSSIGRS